LAGAVTRKGRAVPANRAACADKHVLFAQAALFTISRPSGARIPSFLAASRVFLSRRSRHHARAVGRRGAHGRPDPRQV